ncbi:hypothetical protein ACSBR1_023941 [Camellia fascicularis]
MQMYKMRMEDGTQEYYVNFNSSDCSISCSCKRFESLGLLYRHALRVFNLNNVKKIPEKYILERWTKYAKQGRVGERHSKLAKDNSGNSAKTLQAFALMNLCSNSDATSEIADRNMDNTFEQIKKHNASVNGGDTCEDDGHATLVISDVLIKDPPRLRKKGQTYGRMKGVLERKKTEFKKVGTSKSQALHTDRYRNAAICCRTFKIFYANNKCSNCPRGSLNGISVTGSQSSPNMCNLGEDVEEDCGFSL